MTYKSLSALKTLCSLSDWSISNLQANKLLYISHMAYMHENENQPLIDENFMAWDYGPVLPSVYHSAKTFGSKPIRNIYKSQSSISNETDAWKVLNEAAEFGKKKTASKLVAITHWENGAWAKNYIPGAKGRIISNADIVEEIEARFSGKKSD